MQYSSSPINIIDPRCRLECSTPYLAPALVSTIMMIIYTWIERYFCVICHTSLVVFTRWSKSRQYSFWHVSGSEAEEARTRQHVNRWKLSRHLNRLRDVPGILFKTYILYHVCIPGPVIHLTRHSHFISSCSYHLVEARWVGRSCGRG